MNLRLERILDWRSCAHAANYCVRTLAQNCGVSTRTLDRYIKLRFGKCPREWLLDLRMQRAMELLSDDASVKETALALGYKNRHHFTREFKKCTGHSPCAMQANFLPPKNRRLDSFLTVGLFVFNLLASPEQLVWLF